MAIGDIIKAMAALGNGGVAGSGTRPAFLDGAGGSVRPAFGAIDAIQGAQARADEIAARTEKTIRNPVARAFLGIPSERPTPQWLSTAASIAGAAPRPSAATDAAGLPGGNFSSLGGEGRILGMPQERPYGWQSLGPLGERDQFDPRPLVHGLATNSKGPNPTGAEGPLLGSGAGGHLWAYSPPRVTAGLSDLPILGGLGRLVQGYLGLSRRLEELVAPDEAKAWLRKRLEHRDFEIRMDEYRRRGRQISYAETGDLEGLDGILREHLRGRAPRDASAEWQFFEEQSAELILQELAAVLSERQLQVVARFLEEQAHEQPTYEEIGRELGMAPGTVKSHVFRVRNNPGVSEILKPDGTQSHERPHRR